MMFMGAAAAALVGVGVVGALVGYAVGVSHRRLRQAAGAAPKVFLSYRRRDASLEMADLFRRLAAIVGEENIFRDLDIEAGGEFPKVLDRTLRQCRAAIVLIGPEWAGIQSDGGTRRIDEPDDWVRLEVSMALRRRVTILPVLVRGAVMPEARTLPQALHGLSRLQAISVAGNDFHKAADEIAASLGLSRTGALAHRMRQEHNDLVERFSPDFWDCLQRAYATFAARRGLDRPLHDFIVGSGAPPNLVGGVEFLDYAPPADRADVRDIWEFAQACYPISTARNREALKEQSIAPNILALNEARSRFCGFWDSWANQRNVPAVALEYAGDAPLIVANTWLDIAHRQWTRERNKPKPALARLCAAVVEAHRRQSDSN